MADPLSTLSLTLVVARKEVRELVRDPISSAVAVLVPVILLFIFGYALRLDLDEAPTAILDLDGTPASRELAATFDRTREYEVTELLDAPVEVSETLARGRARIVVVIPAGFGRDLARGDVTRIQTLVDGSFSATARIVAGYSDALVRSFAHRWVGRRGEGSPPPLVEARIWYNPSLDSTTSVVPGLLGVILMAFPPLLTALAVVREKERGTIQQIQLSSLPPSVFVLGKLLPYALLAVAELGVLLVAARLLFRIPLRGNPLALVLVSVLYVLATLGIGLFVSSVARTQVVALLLVLVVTVMPSFMFSGFLYPIFTMPPVLQAYTHVFPGRYFVSFARGLLLKGVGLDALLSNVLFLGLYALVITTLAIVFLRRPAD
jgi:ABC-2 type transport system permease protein